jgi:hypothetical protein
MLGQVACDQIVAFGSNNRMILAVARPRLPAEDRYSFSPREFYEATVSDDPITRRLDIALPSGADVVNAQYSPSCDRILWWLTISAPRPYPHWLERLFGVFGYPGSNDDDSPVAEALWVSRADGRDIREIGQVEVRGLAAGLSNAEWMLDGRQVSFFYLNQMYTVPVY